MKQIIAATNHEASRGSPPALPSPVHSPGKYPNYQKNVQACGNFATTGNRPELRYLELSQNPNLSKLERDYRAWQYKNPDSHDSCPARFTPVFDSWERKALGDDFVVKVKSDSLKKQLEEVAEAFKRDKPGMNKRRASELIMSERFRGDIADLGSMEYKRGGEVFFENPVDVADRLSSCRQSGNVGLKPGGGHVVAYEQKCGLGKICPDESRAESMRLAQRYVPPVEMFLDEKRSHTIYFLVPTRPNYALGHLAEGKREIFSDYRKLNERKCFGVVKGSMAIQEDPLSAHLDWNPHLNVLLLVDGYLNYKEVKNAWVFNIEIISEAQMIAKTKAKLKEKGIDVSKMTRTTLLAHAFMELSKYAAAPLTSKSASKSALGKSEAPPLTEWPAVPIREWYVANKYFRRTRTYGVLYDIEGYRWRRAKKSLRREWLDIAGLDCDLSTLNWRKKEDSLTKEHRAPLRKAMKNEETIDMSLIEWIGPIKYVIGQGYQTPFDLIQGNKLGFSGEVPSRLSQDYPCKPPTGPPPDEQIDACMVESWAEYSEMKQ